jgi:hypothetical protein
MEGIQFIDLYIALSDFFAPNLEYFLVLITVAGKSRSLVVLAFCVSG